MPLKQLPTDLPIHSFASPTEFEAFLDREHLEGAGCYIKLAKKASGIRSITAPEAVEVCLCFGWIDGGGGGSIDETWWLIRYTPRRPKSIWSTKNTNTVARLTEEGKMRPAGLAAVATAKKDGRWYRAYDGPATITVPDDLMAALTAEPAAFAFFKGLKSSERYAVLHRVHTCSLKTRSIRIQAMVQMLAAGNVPGRPAKTQSLVKDSANLKKTNKQGITGSVKKSITKTTAANQNKISKKPLKVRSSATTTANEPRRPGLRPRG